MIARSQILGGVVAGHRHGARGAQHARPRARPLRQSHNLGEYHVPVHADVPAIDVVFVEERDDVVNPLGVKGLGEIGIVGVAAAIANAVFHATGRRIREAPSITLDSCCCDSRRPPDARATPPAGASRRPLARELGRLAPAPRLCLPPSSRSRK